MDILIIFLPVTIFAIILIAYCLSLDYTDKYNKIIAKQELKCAEKHKRECMESDLYNTFNKIK